MARLSAVFFLSGAAALIFETLWFRQAGLGFGNSVWASSLVLASFMAGLALGNGLSARFGERLRRPLEAYAVLEVVIAITGVGLVLLLPLLGGWFAPLFRQLTESAWLLNTVRLGLAFALLLLPATAMGATLPIVVRAMGRLDPSFGSALGRLYGWNTIGAVAGAIAGEAFLIGALGIRGTAFFAAVCDLAAAGLAMLIARGLKDAMAPEEPVAAPAPLNATALACCSAAFLSGGLLLALEVIWFRFLHLFVHSGSLAFALMLSVVLAGIALGGLAAGFWVRHRPDAIRHLPALALIAGVVVIASYALFRFAVEPFGITYIGSTRDVLFLSAVLAFPACFISGILFTLTGSALFRSVNQRARAAGWLTLCNTSGACLGPLLAGFVLLPALGMERSFFWLALGYVPTALLLFAATKQRPLTLWVATATFLIAVFLFPTGLMQESYLSIPIRRATLGREMEVTAVREGTSQTLVYLRSDFMGQPIGHKLITDGYSMSGTFLGSRRYMKLFVYWPVALRPDPKQALLISYGTGSTAKALTETASLERIDIVDTSREILEMTDQIFPEGQSPLADPRVQVHVEDGRYFLQTTDQRFDLITGEPPPPKIAGVVSLYTREYFQLVHDRLNEGGINTYWLPVQNLSEADTLAIIRAYCDVFADCSLWDGYRLNWMLVGSRNGRWEKSEQAFRKQWNDPAVVPELRALGFEMPEQIGATFMADAQELATRTAETLPLTDNHPKRLSDHRPDLARGNDVLTGWMNTEKAAQQFKESELISRMWPDELRQRTLHYFKFQQLIEESYARPPIKKGARRQMQELHEVLTRTPLRTLALWQLGLGSDELKIMQTHMTDSPNPALLAPMGVRALAGRDFDQAATLFGAARSHVPRDLRLLQFEAYSMALAGRPEPAIALLKEGTAHLPEGSPALGDLQWLSELLQSSSSGVK